MNRRQFLQQSSIAAAGGLGAAFPPSSWAIEPIKRSGEAKFKFSLAAYSYRDLLTGDKPALSLEDFISDCAKMQLDAVELTSYYFPKQPSDDYLLDLKALCFRLGLDVSGTAVRNDFCRPQGKERDRDIAAVKDWIGYAATLGAPVIRVFSGNAAAGQSPDEAQRLAVAGIEECCEYAGKHGIFLALENHGGLTETVGGMLALVRAVRSPWFGVNLDTGNFHSADVYGDLAELAPYALNVQVKVVVQPADGKEQPSDFPRLAKILRDAGYRGYIVLEYEEAEDPREVCPRYVQELRQAFA